jgi:hypothetical protein
MKDRTARDELTVSVSGTFLKFIDPLLSELGYPDPKTPEFDHVLKIGWSVWNAVVKNDLEGDTSFLSKLHEAIPAPFLVTTEMLMARKRRLFSKEQFLLGICEARRKPDGSYTLYAEARESSAVGAH